ncbi:Rapamycin-insensitive companion of mTOR, N-term-domain-containing protein [Fusarium oxysporum]|nr:Rapamycin-insensitive companion of mTOR, N-term-domain-containing protein [Fusarium oxysporum]
MLSSSAAAQKGMTPPSQPSQHNLPQQLSGRTSFDRGDSGLQPPNGANARNLSASAVSFAPRGSSLNVAPGSFSSELRSRAGSKTEAGSIYPSSFMDKVEEDDVDTLAEQALAHLKERLNREMKIKEGSENMLEALNSKKAKQTKEQRQKVEAELNASNLRIKDLRQKISDAQHTRQIPPATPKRNRTQSNVVESGRPIGLRSPQSVSRSVVESDNEEPTESPTFALAELLQALEVEGMMPEYYVSRGNQLVDLFKRYPTLKYDLVWSIFGLRMQVMLLSESREVVAAGYRMTRYAISDVASLKKIRSLNTDYLVIRSLNNYRKADVEREQALKFVRAFLDVKGGVKEISRAVVRTIVAVAEHGEDRRANAQPAEGDLDRLRPICIETLAELIVQDPALLVASGGLGPLTEALSEGVYKSPESLTSAFLYLLDSPRKRKYIQPGYGLEVLFTVFTDHLLTNESIMKQNSKAIATALKSWPGLMTLCMYDLRTIRSLITSMLLPSDVVRETILDLIFSLLRIKPPAWATSFLAGRRLTTYGRVANLKSNQKDKSHLQFTEEDSGEQNFVEHYTALLLAVLIRAGLLPVLLKIAQGDENPTLQRKTTLLISEVLKLSSRLLPPSWSAELHLLPELFSSAANIGNNDHWVASGIVYQISSVSRTLYRSAPTGALSGALSSGHNSNDISAIDEAPKSHQSLVFDDATFRQLLIDSNVLNSSNYAKWNWETILKIIDGPLQSGKRLEEAIKASKFMKRIISFYRPFKYRFANVKNTRATQKYVRAGCALMHSLLQSPEGIKFLADSKLLRQIAECLAQCDPTSGLTAQYPMFSRDRVTDTLCAGYFSMLGVLSGDPKGLQLLERWRMFNMMYHIVDLKQRPDLIKLLLSSFDYSVQGHPRVLLSKALTAGTKEIRIHATNALRKYAIRPVPSANGQGGVGDSKWAIQLLVTQLYDPEIEVCATAVKILEKACNRKTYLEYIVECRPALDHLGEIGAPLLLRFLSTSVGYHYLDGLDYISNEMDDWFLGRNDTYVRVIEASLAKAFLIDPDEHNPRMSLFDDGEIDGDYHDNHVPPHFYRELTRTQEGCRLLSDKGHFEDFAATIREHGMDKGDAEMLTKVKGCLWAVGNVGSMELGAPFLESNDVVEHIIRIAETHEVMSLRGTAFFVLGLISRSTHGLEILSEHGWDANTTPMGTSLGFCIPNDLSRLLSLTAWKQKTVTSITLPSSQRTAQEAPPPRAARPPLEPAEIPALLSEADVNRRVLELIVDLGNMVLYKKALTDLQKLRAHKPSAFKSTQFFKEVMSAMEWNHYRLGVRRMVIDLFDKNVMRQIVFDEEEDDEDDDSSDDNSQEESEEESGEGDNSSGDDRTERQRSISEPPAPPPDLTPAPLRLRSLRQGLMILRNQISFIMVQGRVLVIAGSDSSGGAGLEADQKVIAAHGCYAMTATTALTAQNTQGVKGIHVIPTDFVSQQIDACVEDVGVDVVKTGMLASTETIEMVAKTMVKHSIPSLVVDPVMVSTSGATLLPNEAIQHLCKHLLPHTTVLTPNIPEAILILSQNGQEVPEVRSVQDLETVAQRIQALGPKWVLVKGGHRPMKEDLTVAETEEERIVVIDVLVGGDGEVVRVESPYQASSSTHGTGCSLASAIASNLAKGLDTPTAVRSACRYIEAAIRTAPGLGKGHGPLNHFHSTYSLPFAPGYFIEWLLERPDVRDVWKEFVYHPFVMAMGDGTLPLESFKGYIIQDYLYLIHFSRANALAAYKAQNIEDISRATEIVQHIMHELKLHTSYCESFACTAYTRYVLDVGQNGDWVGLQMALAPCLLGYGAAAKMLHDHEKTVREGNTYWAWIKNYNEEDYTDAVKLGSALLEKHIQLQSPSRIEELVQIFIHALKMEIGFWEMFPAKQT